MSGCAQWDGFPTPPLLRSEVQSGKDFSATTFIGWNLDAMYLCLVVYFVPMYITGEAVFPDGHVCPCRRCRDDWIG